MNAWLSLPLPVRLTLLAILGAVAGSAVNWAVYALAFTPRPISPWSSPPPKAARRSWLARVPIIGWWYLRSESPIHGTGFWFRPLCLEVATAALFVFLYSWEVDLAGLVPELPRPVKVIGWNMQADEKPALLHAEYASHIVLLALMLAASFIDIDEKIIPDEITVPGTLLGLVIAAALPMSLLPIIYYPPHVLAPTLAPLHLCGPLRWPDALDGSPHILSLGIGLGCLWLWCFALVERPWRSRRGFAFALKMCCARMFRSFLSPIRLGIALLGSAAIVGVWLFGSAAAWQSLLTALVGMSGGSCLIWVVRLIGFAALRKEAMGFGDVTLMGMIGAFVGWQACLIIFFLAPLAGLVIGVAQWILRRDNEIPYGPFLCLATLGVILCWATVWNRVREHYILGWQIPAILFVGLVLMAVMLRGWRFIAERWLAK